MGRRSGRIFRVVAGIAVLAIVAAGCVTRVSVNDAGVEGNGDSDELVGISDDGRYVLFVSDASNLVAGDTNGKPDVFRRDTEAKTTTRVSVAANGSQLPAGATDGAVTPDQRFIAFVTETALDAGDTNGLADIYLRDLTANTLTWESKPPPGGFPAVGQVQHVTRGFSGAGLAISDDGRYVSFLYQHSGFPPPTDFYRRDRQTGTTTKLLETQFLGSMQASGDARHFVLQPRCFQCPAPSAPILLDIDGSANGWPALGPYASCDLAWARMNPTGRYLIWRSAGENPATCLAKGGYLVDRVTGTVTQLGTIARQAHSYAGLNRDATSVVFEGDHNLLPGGPRPQVDLYVTDLVQRKTSRLNLTPEGSPSSRGVDAAIASDGGTRVAFTSTAPDLVPDDSFFWTDVFARPVGVSPPP